jgi:glucose-1-phosphate cytidylyltransferase
MLYKVIILAGGLGTRLSEETLIRPKPMVEIGGIPILLHIMRIFNSQIECEFFVATGYKSEMIEKYLSGKEFARENITATAVFTGDDTATAGRIKKIMDLYPGETFFMTYGDGVANIDISRLLSFHQNHSKIATVTAVRPVARYGRLQISEGLVTDFAEKSQTQEGWINGGFFLLNADTTGFIDGYMEMFEQEPLSRLTQASELMAFEHNGFWQPMDTLREKIELDNLASSNEIPWMVHRK